MYSRLYTLDCPLFTDVVCIELEVSEEFHLSSLDAFLYIIYFQHRKWGEEGKGMEGRQECMRRGNKRWRERGIKDRGTERGRKGGMHEEREQEMEGERNIG